jgi:hypothetical protein
MEASSNSTKQGWATPELTVYGDVATITAGDATECDALGGDGLKSGIGSDDAYGVQSDTGEFSCLGIARF